MIVSLHVTILNLDQVSQCFEQVFYFIVLHQFVQDQAIYFRTKGDLHLINVVQSPWRRPGGACACPKPRPLTKMRPGIYSKIEQKSLIEYPRPLPCGQWKQSRRPVSEAGRPTPGRRTWPREAPAVGDQCHAARRAGADVQLPAETGPGARRSTAAALPLCRRAGAATPRNGPV